VTVLVDDDYTFDHNGTTTSGFVHIPDEAAIRVLNAGTYKVSYTISGTGVTQMALFINGTVVDGTTYGSGAGTQPNAGQAIVTIAADDILTLNNHSSTAAVGLATPIGGSQPTTNASIVIEKIG
jgi:hypothetical protein